MDSHLQPCYFVKNAPTPLSHFDPQIILAVAIHAQRPHLPDDMPAPMRALIIRCWDHTPKKRPTVPEVLFSLESLIREEVDGRTAQIAALRKRSQSQSSRLSTNLGAGGSMGSRVGSSGGNRRRQTCISAMLFQYVRGSGSKALIWFVRNRNVGELCSVVLHVRV